MKLPAEPPAAAARTPDLEGGDEGPEARRRLAEAFHLPLSIAQLLIFRGYATHERAEAFLDPSLGRLRSPHAFGQMEKAVQRLLAAVRADEPIAIYADRDVDGLSGLAILVRTVRSVGGRVVWGSPMKGRGVEREVLERLAGSGAKVLIVVDCGTAEHAELDWLDAQGIDVIVADHHRFMASRPKAFAWIHPGVLEEDDGEAPAGCVMAFKLAQGIWLSFLGNEDPERMDYFLFSHLDLISLGILADRMPLTGENRILVWHGLRRLACSRKAGISALTRFFRLTPRSGPLTVHEVTWQLIPLLNAGGRLGRPDLAADLLITEDLDTAHDCINELLAFNTQRRAAQDKSWTCFEKAVVEQCCMESDAVFIALADGVEPSVTGLAAQAMVRKYGRPAFLFVRQGDVSVGSGRGFPGLDLFAWVEAHQEWVVKYGGHQGAVGLTIRTADFDAFRGLLLATARQACIALDPARSPADNADISSTIEGHVALHDLTELWWMGLERMGPFGTGHPLPLFRITGIEEITPKQRRRSKNPMAEVVLKNKGAELRAQIAPEEGSRRRQQGLEEIRAGACAGPWTVVGYPVRGRRGEGHFKWMIRDLWRDDAERSK